MDFYFPFPYTLFIIGIGGLILGYVFLRPLHYEIKRLWIPLIIGWTFLLLLFHSQAIYPNNIHEFKEWAEAGILYTIFMGFVAIGNHRLGGE
jgi:hypothetical protein